MRPRTKTPAEAPWDPRLTAALQQSGRRIEEELLLDRLLADLAGAGARRPG
ncbi:DUF2399 domain-containing protein [Streptomyces sp. NPDC044780]|uniref:DUF2399 domain-containing protein n=1 Tax=unclassified Streptomyces TaxID=2593676 RepID=UPI0033FA6113